MGQLTFYSSIDSLLTSVPVCVMGKEKTLSMHEIVGEVTEVGSKVNKVKIGDKVGVGCMVGACHACESCNSNLENYCPKMILT
ncbi:unnamed protein product [Malus baccata var. baccata]